MTGRTLLRRCGILCGAALLVACSANPSAGKAKAPSAAPASTSATATPAVAASDAVTTDPGSRLLPENPLGAVSVETPPLSGTGSRGSAAANVPAAAPGRPWIPPPPPPPGDPGR